MDQSRELVKEPETIAQIRFQDCDPLGHLNNARYLDYFLNARMDQVQQAYGLSPYERQAVTAASWVIKRNQIAYLRPAALGAEVRIRTRIVHFTDTSFVVEGLMLDRSARHLMAFLWTEFVYVNVTSGRPTRHPDQWYDLLRAVVVDDGYDASDFTRRVEQTRQQLRERIA
jgi:acyl-CoA thioester hydrolase